MIHIWCYPWHWAGVYNFVEVLCNIKLFVKISVLQIILNLLHCSPSKGLHYVSLMCLLANTSSFSLMHFWDLVHLPTVIPICLAMLLSVSRGTTGIGSWPVMICQPWCKQSAVGHWLLSYSAWIVHLASIWNTKCDWRKVIFNLCTEV